MLNIGLAPSAGEAIWIRIRADLTDLREGLTQAATSVRGWSKNVGDASNQLRRMGTSMMIVGSAMAGVIALATKNYAKFQQSMANTFSVFLTITDKQKKKLEDLARILGKTTVYAAYDVAAAMYYLASAGYDVEETLSAITGITTLAAATQFDLAHATEIVVGTLNSYGLAASESTRVANTFAAVITYTQATLEKLGDSFKYVGPLARQVGISVEQTAAIFGLLYNAGMAANQAGTYIRQGLIRLQKPTKEARAALLQLGLSVQDVNPQFHDLVDIVRAFENAGAAAATKADELVSVFDMRAATAFSYLIKRGAGAIEDMESKITNTNKAAEMMKIQMNTLLGSLKLLKGALVDASIAFGESVGPAINSIILGLRTLTNSFNSMPQGVKSTVSSFFLLGTALTLVTGTLLIFLSKIPVAITALKSVGVLASISFGKVMLLVTALSAVGYALFKVSTAAEKHREQMKKLNEETQISIDHELDNIKVAKELAEEYFNAEKKINSLTDRHLRQDYILRKLHKIYPDLIKDSKDYKGVSDDVAKVLDIVNGKMHELFMSKLALSEIRLTMDIINLQKEMKEIKEEWKDTSLAELFESILPDAKIAASTELLEIYSKKIKTLPDIFNWGTKSIADRLSGDTVYNMVELGKELEKNLSLAKTDSEIMKIIAQYTDDVGILTKRANELRMEQLKYENQSLISGGKEIAIIKEKKQLSEDLKRLSEEYLNIEKKKDTGNEKELNIRIARKLQLDKEISAKKKRLDSITTGKEEKKYLEEAVEVRAEELEFVTGLMVAYGSVIDEHTAYVEKLQTEKTLQTGLNKLIDMRTWSTERLVEAQREEQNAIDNAKSLYETEERINQVLRDQLSFVEELNKAKLEAQLSSLKEFEGKDKRIDLEIEKTANLIALLEIEISRRKNLEKVKELTPEDIQPITSKYLTELERQLWNENAMKSKANASANFERLAQNRIYTENLLKVDMKYMDKTIDNLERKFNATEQYNKADVDLFVKTLEDKMAILEKFRAANVMPEVEFSEKWGAEFTDAFEKLKKWHLKFIELADGISLEELKFKIRPDVTFDEAEWKNYINELINRLTKMTEIPGISQVDLFNIKAQILDLQKLLKTPEELKLHATLDFESSDLERMKTDSLFMKDEEYTAALEALKAYKEKELETWGKYSDEYQRIKADILNIDEQLMRSYMDKYKILLDSTTDIMLSGVDAFFDEWSQRAGITKIQMKNVFTAIKDAALQAFRDILAAEITKALLRLFVNILGWLSGDVLAAIENRMIPETSGIPGLATGANIQQTGLAKVHRGEVIVPASIVRKNRSNYEQNYDGRNKNNNYDRNVNVPNVINLTLVNPVVNDKLYWQKVTEDHITPAMDTLIKRTSKKGKK